MTKLLRLHDVEAINSFVIDYPNWWISIGVCEVSRDFSTAPTDKAKEIEYIKKAGDCWDSGFHCDHKGTVEDAINDVRVQIRKALELIDEI